MKKEKFYKKIKSIVDFYSGEYELSEYIYPELNQKFDCYNPRLTLKEMNNYIEIKFSGSFPLSLEFRHADYTIKVFNNDKISNNISWTDRHLFEKIIKYLESEFYYKVEEYKQNKAKIEREKKIKEMNRDHNIDKYINMSKDILFGLGHTYRTDDINNYNESVTEACSYEGYGLKITAYNLPGYVYNDDKTGGLQSFIKKYMNNIRINYNDKEVFDSKNETYIKGIWEKVFLELYNKLDILVDKKKQNFNNEKHCIELMEEVILPLHYEGVSLINDSLKLTLYEENSYRVNNCGAFEYDKHYKVIKDGIDVLHVVEINWHNFIVYSYTPGSWEYELKKYLVELENKRVLKDEEDGLQYIKQLRKLK